MAIGAAAAGWRSADPSVPVLKGGAATKCRPFGAKHPSRGNTGCPMFNPIPKLFASILLLTVAATSHAEEPGKIDLEAAQMVAELIGAPVLAKDGVEVGQVAEILYDADLQPKRLRMTTDAALGFGVRTLEIPKGTFMPVRGAIILDVPAEAISAFAELAEPPEEK